MTNFFNSVGDLRFFNFIDPTYYSGVPTGGIKSLESTNWHFCNWMRYIAFPGDESHTISISGTNVFDIGWYFPAVPNTATANETCTGAASATNRRFRLNAAYSSSNMGDLRILSSYDSYYNVAKTFYCNTSDTGIVTEFSVPAYKLASSAVSSASDYDSVYNWFPFGVKSPTTLALAEIQLTQAMGGSLSNHFALSQVVICGWLHDSIYQNAPAAPETQQLRYNSCYILILSQSGTVSYFSGLNSKRPTEKSITTTVSFACSFYPLTCPEYTGQSLFLSDLILIDSIAPYNQVGRVDNRVACIGRGLFQLGKIYKATNIFGRTGIEYWLCFAKYTPSSYSPPTWIPGNTLSAEKFQTWRLSQEDWLLIRVYVEEVA